MRGTLRALGSAFAYFSIVPVRFVSAPPDADALAMLPLVGAVIGACSGALCYVSWPFVPHAIVFACAFIAPVILSGAIHIDGFLDSCDALFASVSAQRRLEIMKDPVHGSFALAGMAAVSVAWWSVLQSCGRADFVPWLVLALMLGRATVVSLALFVPYARGGRPPIAWLLLWYICAQWLAFAINPWDALVPPLVLCCALAGGFAVKRRLDGVLVGDSYGFLIVLCELLCLLLLAIVQQLIMQRV